MKRRSLLTTAAAAAALCMSFSAAAEDVTLRFSWWGGGARHDATLKAIAAFEAKNPGIKIKGEYMGFAGYQERLSTQYAGGTEPDIMQINWAWLSTFSKTGDGFYDLNKSKAVLALNQFAESDLKTGIVNGKLNALPVSYTARVMLWNMAAYGRAGLKMPATWDELFAAGPVIKQKLGDKAFAIDGELYDMILLSQTYIQQKHGTPYVSPSQPKVAMSEAAALEWVQTYKKLVANNVAVPLPVRASLGGAEKPTEQQQDWVVGNWAGNYTWDSTIGLRASTLDKSQKLDVGDFLTLPGAKSSGMFGRPSMMFAVSKRSKNPEIAAKFLNYLMTDPDAAAIVGMTRGVPTADSQFRNMVRTGALQGAELKAYLQIKKLKDAGKIELPSPLFENARFQKFVREVFETVAYGKATEQEAAKRLVEEGNALLNKIK
ncbi:carbohydrate ABC transporter substrate-binding protein [Curvibacter sp. CHRR-16]|uniref:ABC transporter substrate-binding protein n=1 Tax=Curvibacter sp. CHRR-16 TaxID=2835872 RepID=UPI001BD95E9A|nr:ABC transporter substrate-binding protein [Curvibacter sp. CHRR-16]MBT0570178.1 carbohydrate ABC transporter substrate-binding protein [Curvibacter sp. CHRR-16]